MEVSVESLDSLFVSGISGFSDSGTELDRAMGTTAGTGAVSVLTFSLWCVSVLLAAAVAFAMDTASVD